MVESSLEQDRYFTVSSSISNWEDKIRKRYRLKNYVWWRDYNKPVVFFGFYKPKDWLKFFLHRGEKTIVWCGSDCFQVGLLFRLLKKVKAKHICESGVEWGVLTLALQQDIIKQPLFFGNTNGYNISYKQQKNQGVFIHINTRAEKESGYFEIKRVAYEVPEITFHIYGRIRKRKCPDNIKFHGHVSEKRFNKEIQNYQASLRLHEFDGFADTTAKSVLMGQYPITRIKYPLIDHAPDEKTVIKKLRELGSKTKPNHKARNYYIKIFNDMHFM